MIFAEKWETILTWSSSYDVYVFKFQQMNNSAYVKEPTHA